MPAAAPDLALLGVGYMGGSLALAARAAGIVGRIVGHDPDGAAATAARTRGVVDAMAASPAEAAQGAGLVVLAGPVRTMGVSLAAIARVLRPDAVVIDVG